MVIPQGLFEGWRCTSLHWLRLDDLYLGLKHRHEMFFSNKSVCCSGPIDIACFTYHILPYIGRWHMERYAAGLDA